MKIVRAGRFASTDPAVSPYRLLPFPVPRGTKRIEVRYAYDREAGNVLDLGLFDPRGSEFLAAEGFRGWSGSARDHVVVTEHAATPGYLPGPIIAGTWHILLGLYQVASGGCHYLLEIFLSDVEGELPEERPPAHSVDLMPHRGPGWFKGDLHSHSYHSDARCSVGELAAVARRRGLDFLAITDHNTVSHHAHLAAHSGPDLCLIPGQEVTTYYGHANVWGPGRWLDFRCRTTQEIGRVCAEAHREGRLFSVNHPKPNGPEWNFGLDVPFDCVEVWQRPWPWENDHSLAFWEHLLRSGRRVVAVGGSDSHPFPLANGRLFDWLGYPTTWVYAQDLTVESVLAGIRAGHVTISACVSGAQAVLIARGSGQVALQGDVVEMDECLVEVRVVDGEGLWLRLLTSRGEVAREVVPSADWVFEHDLALADHGYVRAEIRVPDARHKTPIEGLPMAAMTNPVWHSWFLRGSQKGGSR